MSLAWIVYALAVGALLSVAAWASERLLRSAGRQGRWAWVGAGIASLLVPLLALTGLGPDVAALFEGLMTFGEEGGGAVELPAATVVTETTAARVEGGWSWSFVPSLSQAAELGLLGAWGLASVAVLGVYALTWRRLRRRLARWPRAEIEGSPVRITRATGPAVVGILRPVMMVPAWIHDLPSEKRKLVLRHEREHLRAGDSRLLALFPLLVALAPWNLPLWWQLRRLRLAVELDCDARVLADGSETADYGRLLVSMSRGPEGWIESGGLPLTTAALVERKSDLERRIRTMIESREKTPVLHTATLAALAGLALFVACDAPAPVESETETEADVAGSIAPAEESGETDAPVGPWRPDVANDNSAGLWIAPDGDAGNATTRRPPPPESGSVADRPAYIPREVDPKLTNASEIERMLERRYPLALRETGVSGRAVLWLLVDATGDVEQVLLQQSSGLETLDSAAMQVAQNMKFEPARDADGPLGVWITQPVSFRADPGTSTSAVWEREDAPLIIVDGVIMADASRSDLNALDIATIDVVKGPAAERLYGERAADGLIQITTKDAVDGGS